MAYISKVPNDLITVGVDAFVINTNTQLVLTDIFYDEKPIVGTVVAENGPGNNPNVAEPGETVTINTNGGGTVTGTYVGPVVFSTVNTTIGIPLLANINVKINDVNGYAVQGDDGQAYIVSDVPIGDNRLGATVTAQILGISIELIDVPVAEINNAIANRLQAAADAMNPEWWDIAGQTAKQTMEAAAATARAAGQIIQAGLDVVTVNVANGTHLFDDGVTCFMPGTLILTERGEVKVEELSLEDRVLNAKGEAIQVMWIGKLTLRKENLRERHLPTLIKKDALEKGVPHSDLYVTADHGMILGDIIANAGALVNGESIQFVSLSDISETVTYYHIETKNHEAIIANGAKAESFIDYVGRSSLDNYREYLSHHGADRIIKEMPLPRASSARQLPEGLVAKYKVKEISINSIDDIAERILVA